MYVHQLSYFFKEIADDPRITPTHISLYMAIFQQWNLLHFENPVVIKREDIMRESKISGRPTYFRCIRDLQEFGYIKYVPAKHRYERSHIYL